MIIWKYARTAKGSAWSPTITASHFTKLTLLCFPGGSTMRHIYVATCLVTILLVNLVAAADQAQKALVSEKKAEVLEKNAASDGSKALPSPSEIIKKTEVLSVDPVGEEPLNDAITCLSRTIYWEARGEGTADMEAIANVVMNRLGHEGFPDKICKVVMQGREDGACQFSWWCDGKSDDAKEDKSYAIAKEIARKALNRQLKDLTGGALYFHQREANPSWSNEYIKTVEIGVFVFYKPRGGSAK
jgi:spore germination cell wall hydrolase CwlJ-like protein